MATVNSEDENFIYFEHEFSKIGEETTLDFAEGRIAIKNADIQSEGNRHALKKGAQINILDKLLLKFFFSTLLGKNSTYGKRGKGVAARE